MALILAPAAPWAPQLRAMIAEAQARLDGR